jgi:predicted DNA-binding transcriptional regulator YafY
MSEDEVLALQLARGLLAPPDDAGDDPLHRAFEGIMDRLGITPDPNAQEVAVLNHHRKERYQPDHLRELMRAIRTGRSITMQYASAKGRRAKVVVQPLCMVISEGEWFCYAWEPGPRRSKLFKVARIRSLRTGDRLAGAPAGASLLRSELRCAFRNSLGGARERVVVRFSRQAWPQVRDRVWGDDQQVAFIDDGLGEEAEGAPGAWHYGQAVWELSFVTEGLEAVRHWLLQFGAHVEAITPKHLRVWIASQSGMTYENHRDVDKPLFPPIKRPMTLINPACELDPEGILRFDG